MPSCRPAARRGAAPRFAVLALAAVLCLSAPAAADDELTDNPEREITPIGEVRFRPELRDNADFDADRRDRQRFYGQRTRIGLDAKINPKLEGRVLLQDTRIWGVGEGAHTAQTGTEKQATDLYEGYVDLRWIWDLPLDVRLGRQALAFGRERLVGALDWSNSARTFDAYKFRFTMGSFVLDAFSAKLVDTNAPDPDTTRFVSDRDRNFSGLYIAREGDEVERADIYWLRDIDKTRAAVPAETRRHTVGALARVRLPASFAVEGEVAYQSGDPGPGLDLSAHMLTAEIHYARPRLRDLKLAGGLDWASGDRDLGDRDVTTFNQLFPTGHAFLGTMDYIGRQNVRDYRLQASATLVGALTGVFHYHRFELDSAADAWYDAAGSVHAAGDRVFGPDAGRSERGLGSEIDLVFRFGGLIDQAVIDLGYSRFFPGDVVRLGGAADDGSDWAYLLVKLEI